MFRSPLSLIILSLTVLTCRMTLSYPHLSLSAFTISPMALASITFILRIYLSFFHRRLAGNGAFCTTHKLWRRRKQSSELHRPMTLSKVCASPLVSNPPCSAAMSDPQIRNGRRQGHGTPFTALMLLCTSMPELIVWLVKPIYRFVKHIVSDQISPSYMWRDSAFVEQL